MRNNREWEDLLRAFRTVRSDCINAGRISQPIEASERRRGEDLAWAIAVEACQREGLINDD